jgi:hypothetical protein
MPAICNGDDSDPVRLNTNRAVGITLEQQGLTPNLATVTSWSEITRAELATCTR